MLVEKFVREKVSSNLEVKQGVKNEVAFDPTIILTIIQVLMTLFQDCSLFKKKPEEIQATVKKVGLFERWALRQQVRNAIDDNRIFKLYGAQIVNALCECGHDVTVEEIKAILDEVMGD